MRRRPLQVGRWITGKPTEKINRNSHYVVRPKWAAFHRATNRARAARHHHRHRHRAPSARHRATTDLAAAARRSVLQDLRPELREPILLLVSDFAKPSGQHLDLEARVPKMAVLWHRVLVNANKGGLVGNALWAWALDWHISALRLGRALERRCRSDARTNADCNGRRSGHQPPSRRCVLNSSGKSAL